VVLFFLRDVCDFVCVFLTCSINTAVLT
jgi:hypothetical protein